MSGGQGDELNLNLTEPCGSGLKNECKCIPKLDNITATRVPDQPVKGFVKHTHVRTGERTFTLPQILGDNSILPTTIPSVTKVEAYYGNQRPTRPLILAITTDSSSTPTYYTNPTGYVGEDTGQGTWMEEGIADDGELIKKLDNFNCQYNNTIPIDLKNPGSLSRFYLGDGGCLRNRTVSISGTNVTGEYEVKTYQIKIPKTYISRVAYGDTNTDMTIPTDSVSTIKVYTWNNDKGNEKTPLLVAFEITNGKFHYRKNLGKPGNLKWAQASNNSRTERTGPDLTKLLNEARCNSFYTFKVELSGTPGQYKNNNCSEQQIQVAPYGSDIGKYQTYKHTYNGGEEFIVTGFEPTSGATQNIDVTYPIRNVAEVVVYMCSGEPLLVYINSKDPSLSKEWHKYDKNSRSWTPVSESQLSTSSHEKILNILDEINTSCAPPSVTIDIKKKNNDGYADPGSSGKRIKVTKHTDPPNYDRYDHTVEGRDGSYFKLEKVVYDGDTNKIVAIQREDAATLVSVYYWKYGEGVNGKPLLVKVESRKQKSDPKETTDTWYENTGTNDNNIEWKEAEGYEKISEDNTQLKKKLDLLNCRLNNVVIINANKRPSGGSYCHDDTDKLDSTHPSKLNVVEDPSSSKGSLATYKAYEHSINNHLGQPFHIVGINAPSGNITLTGGTGSGTEDSPMKNVTKVIFYFCQEQLKSDQAEPLLIYHQNSTLPTHNWYKSDDGASWTSLGWTEKDPILETNYSAIVDKLDEIGSSKNPCRPPKITVNIKNIATYADVEVTPAPVSTAPNYTEYKHKPNNMNKRDYFTITQVNYNGQRISEISRKDKVLDFSVYYWEDLKSSGNPLLIKINKLDTNGSEETLWYENISTDRTNTTWTPIISYKDKLSSQEDKLEKKLILLNCRLNNVTEIDIGKKPTDPSYCHDPDPDIGEGSHPKLIKVEDISKDSTYNNKIGKFAVYKHDLTEEARQKHYLGTKFHISGFTNKGGTVETRDGSSPTPALNVPKVLVYFCDKDKTKGKPLLVHFKHSTTSNATEKQEWYQRNGDDWTKVEKGVPDGENDIPSIYAILNNYATSCKDDTLLRILLGTAAGSAGGGATTYGVYEMIRWFFMSPWPRLM